MKNDEENADNNNGEIKLTKINLEELPFGVIMLLVV